MDRFSRGDGINRLVSFAMWGDLLRRMWGEDKKTSSKESKLNKIN